MLIGLTGGIGSGKSIVADLFAQKKIKVIDADVIAREKIPANLQTIVQHFGQDILDKSGNLKRSLLRDKIFQNPTERLWLERLLHPQIVDVMIQKTKQSTSPYCIAVVPLLLETKSHFPVDRILVIDAPAELQRQRIQQRDDISDELIDAMFKAQLSREERLAAADDVIINDGTLEKLKLAVEKLHTTYLAL